MSKRGVSGSHFSRDSVMQCKLGMLRLSLAEDEQRNSWSKNGQNFAEMYLWPKVANEIEAAYNDALNK